MRFTLDHGHDAGGLQRHVFSEFGKGLPDLLSISAAADTLAAARALLKGWEPAMTARAHGRDEAEMLSRLCEIAEPHHVLAEKGTVTPLMANVEERPLDSQMVRGFERPVDLVRVVPLDGDAHGVDSQRH